MENKPNLKTKKMTITKVIKKDYRNAPQKGQKKTNPFLVAAKFVFRTKTDRQTLRSRFLRSLGEEGWRRRANPVASKLHAKLCPWAQGIR
jgi:hypothetical protein